MKSRILMLIFGLGVIGGISLASADVTQDKDCQRVRIALDIGSGSTKMRSGLVNVCTQTFIAELARHPSLALPFKDNLSRPDSDKNFTEELLDRAESEITVAVEKLESDTRKVLAGNGQYESLANSEIEVSGGATEAFRQARNTADFIERMKNHGFNVVVLSQQEEGHVGLIGAMVKLSANDAEKRSVDPRKMISWDIGGGSLQMTHYNGAAQNSSLAWNDFGNRLASNPMREFVVGNIQKKPLYVEDEVTSPNPLVTGDADSTRVFDQSEVFVREQISPLLEANWLQPLLRQKNAPRVYGIGGVHGATLRLLKKLTGHESASGYTTADLRELLIAVSSASDQDLIDQFGVEKAFTAGTVTNVLLVYNVMEATGIQSVDVLDVDNTQGLMVSPRFWSDFGDAELQIRTEGQINP